jgi:hypothetical protein
MLVYARTQTHTHTPKQDIAGGNTVHVAKLGQSDAGKQPIYKKNVVNGHGAVRFVVPVYEG